MAVEVMVPRLGWSMESGAFGQWLKQDGDAVAVGEPVFTIEGEKATEEVESLDAGLLHIRPGVAEPGVELTVGTVIGWLLAEGEEVPEAPPDPAAETAGAETARAKSGDGSAPKPETDPGTAPPADGRPAAAAAVAVTVSRGAGADGRPASSPRARRIARELGVDWRLASGSGKGGRIRERDVRAFAARRSDGFAPGAAGPLPDLGEWGPVEMVPLSAARRLTAERLATVAQTVPMATQLGTADVTRLEALRERYASRAQEAGGTLTMAAMLAKVAASALKVFPQCNASIDLAAGQLVRRGCCHVGIAVDTEHGTSFPVVRDADRKNMLQLSAEIAEIAERGRAGTLAPAEMQGGCISIYAPGGTAGAGMGHFTPSVNAPEPAILGVAPAQREPVLDENAGTVVHRLRMPLALTYDCRVLDGTAGMRFLGWIIDALEEPLLLSLEG
ncbi:MAG: 2-oxo acid dehydrogenase subunit E2 [Spirochaetaceae bacterium]|nr:2-oxo acid dehydrogenase subunit E2 [Spirochaetaceae bacterium]